MLTIRLPSDVERRLAVLAKSTGRTKSFYVREAILRHLGDLEDYYLARERLRRSGRRLSLEMLERELLPTRRRPAGLSR